MADQDQCTASAHILPALHMDLRDQRAGCVQHVEATRFCIPFDRLSNAMRAENGHGALRHLIELFDEAGAFMAQVVDHVPVVDDLVTNVHGRAVLL
jgi:hypothetical protein